MQREVSRVIRCRESVGELREGLRILLVTSGEVESATVFQFKAAHYRRAVGDDRHDFAALRRLNRGPP